MLTRALWASSVCASAIACTPLKDDVATDAGIDAPNEATSIDAGIDAPAEATSIDQNFGLAFDGDAYGIVRGANDLRLEDFTIELYAYFDIGQGDLHNLIARPFGQTTYDSYALWLQGAVLHGGANLMDAVDCLGLEIPQLELRWIHIATTFNRATGEEALFIDGVLKQTHMGHAPINYDASDVLFGADGYNGGLEGFFVGVMDDVRIWSVVRTADEISAAMHSRLRGDEAGLEAYWPLDEGSGQTSADVTGHGHVLQLGKTAYAEKQDPQWVTSSAPVSRSE